MRTTPVWDSYFIVFPRDLLSLGSCPNLVRVLSSYSSNMSSHTHFCSGTPPSLVRGIGSVSNMYKTAIALVYSLAPLINQLATQIPNYWPAIRLKALYKLTTVTEWFNIGLTTTINISLLCALYFRLPLDLVAMTI